MINIILDILNEKNIATYRINECIKYCEEAFFIKQKTDMIRAKDITDYTVTLYRNFTDDCGELQCGFASCTLNKTMNKHDKSCIIKNTYAAAKYAKNPYFPLPNQEMNTVFRDKDTTTPINIEYLKKALFSSDIDNLTFINSAEIFIQQEHCRIINSSGLDTSFSQTIYSGEFVVQSLLSEDVELYQNFKFTDSDCDIATKLSQLVSSTLQMTKDRSIATPYLQITSPTTIILNGYCVAELFKYFLVRCDASMIYPKYSDYCIGTKLSLKSDYINIGLKATKSYASDGIKLKDTPLIKNGEIVALTGNSQFSHYLGIKPIGSYTDFDFSLACGTQLSKKFEQGSYLKIVNFSDFQMDSLSGQFGGEFRLAYYCDGKTNPIPVTGGTISGNILDILNTVRLSKEELHLNGYTGPKSICYN